jgi:hypothetical protein
LNTAPRLFARQLAPEGLDRVVLQLEARMWIFTEFANRFDKIMTTGDKVALGWMQDWVATTEKDDSPWYRTAAIYVGADLTYGISKVSAEVLSGFVDVLRVGDGVREGGWGYGQDALRLLVLADAAAGPALRAFRFTASLVAVNVPGERCAWVSGAQALRMTGTHHFARAADLAKAAGFTLEEVEGANVKTILRGLEKLKANARLTGTLYSVEDVAELAERYPDSVILFAVEYTKASGESAGHALLATRGPGGLLLIVDRSSGLPVTSLAALESRYPGISSAIVHGPGILIHYAKPVQLLNNAPLLMNVLAFEIRSVPVPPALLNRPPLLNRPATISLLTNPQLLAGWWWVTVGQWFWCYVFTPDGGVTWSDPYNHRSGKGKWNGIAGSIQIVWDSGSKETWTSATGYVSGQMAGTYTFKGKESDPLAVKALKVAPETVQQLVGKWRVTVDKYAWDYEFKSYGEVTWIDPFNKKTGTGTWSLTKNTVFIAWANSGTREDWDWPPQMNEAQISYRASYGTFKYPQAKASKSG